MFLLGFMAYEVTEDWRLKDGAYVDIYGYLWGLATGGMTLFFMQLLGVM